MGLTNTALLETFWKVFSDFCSNSKNPLKKEALSLFQALILSTIEWDVCRGQANNGLHV